MNISQKVKIIWMAYLWVLPVHITRVNNSYQSLLLDLTKLSHSRIDWLLMPPKGESKKRETMRCLIKTLQTRPSWYVNGNSKNINIGYSLLLLFLKKKKEGNSLILQDHISLDSLILEKADIRKRNITEAM